MKGPGKLRSSTSVLLLRHITTLTRSRSQPTLEALHVLLTGAVSWSISEPIPLITKFIAAMADPAPFLPAVEAINLLVRMADK